MKRKKCQRNSCQRNSCQRNSCQGNSCQGNSCQGNVGQGNREQKDHRTTRPWATTGCRKSCGPVVQWSGGLLLRLCVEPYALKQAAFIVAQVSNLLYRKASSLRVVRVFIHSQPAGHHADWKSAIQQVGNLRYAKQIPAILPVSIRTVLAAGRLLVIGHASFQHRQSLTPLV